MDRQCDPTTSRTASAVAPDSTNEIERAEHVIGACHLLKADGVKWYCEKHGRGVESPDEPRYCPAVAAYALLVREVASNGPLAHDLMVARAEVSQLRSDLWDIAGSVVAVCESGNANMAQLACDENSPLVGSAREAIAAHRLGPDDIADAQKRADFDQALHIARER